MKTHPPHLLGALALLALTTFNQQISTAHAQGTAFTYQGQLVDNGGPANGNYALRFTLYNSSSNFVGAVLAGPLTNVPVTVSNGLFTVLLDFGPGQFTGPPRWLQIDAASNSAAPLYLPLAPRQLLAPAPYAIFASTASNLSGTLPTAQLSGTVLNSQMASNAITVTAGSGLSGGGPVALGGGTSLMIPSGGVSNAMLANASLTISAGPGLQGGGPVALGGSTTLTNAGVLSVTGNADITAMLTSGNVILGDNATSSNAPNTLVKRDGAGNISAGTITGNGSGLTNVNAVTVNGLNAGSFWNVRGNAGTTAGTNLLGTVDNQPLELWVNSTRALRLEPNPNGPNVIGGSSFNSVSPPNYGATIGGGASNTVLNAFATIGGGYGNTASGIGSFIGGGGISDSNGFGGNTANGAYSVLVGGTANTSSAYYASVGGGRGNTIQAGATYSTIGGGNGNSAGGSDATVAGGSANGTYGTFSAIGGGANNVVGTGADYSAVSGGWSNSIAPNATGSFVGGGVQNANGGAYATLGGGYGNAIQAGAPSATVAGGQFNTIQGTNSGGGGAVIAGGDNNLILATGRSASIPGGSYNTAAGLDSFAAGAHARAMNWGSFVWSDSSSSANFGDSGPNQFCVRAAGGVNLSAMGGVNLDPLTDIYFGAQTRQMLNLWSTNYGIGVQAADMYFRTAANAGGFAWYQGGVHSDGNEDPGGGYPLMYLHPDGSLDVHGDIHGNVNFSSDRNLKENFTPVDAGGVLEKVAGLAIAEWQYKKQAAVRHIGPMAQDFYAAFNVGPGEKEIAVVDEGGVALAAIQGLNQKLEDRLKAKDAELQGLRQQLAAAQEAMGARLARLEAAVARLTDKSTTTLAAASGEK